VQTGDAAVELRDDLAGEPLGPLVGRDDDEVVTSHVADEVRARAVAVDAAHEDSGEEGDGLVAGRVTVVVVEAMISKSTLKRSRPKRKCTKRSK
jgi:hypothetical protein